MVSWVLFAILVLCGFSTLATQYYLVNKKSVLPVQRHRMFWALVGYYAGLTFLFWVVARMDGVYTPGVQVCVTFFAAVMTLIAHPGRPLTRGR